MSTNDRRSTLPLIHYYRSEKLTVGIPSRFWVVISSNPRNNVVYLSGDPRVIPICHTFDWTPGTRRSERRDYNDIRVDSLQFRQSLNWLPCKFNLIRYGRPRLPNYPPPTPTWTDTY
ncbi:uncharacterized protein LOC141530583 [Cotesia typhae]|uniref:uncharacterized protein LOC141530583 n=1 Tax=Cotesia typhae TaxID=2053667 RepID=UPI003D69B8CE